MENWYDSQQAKEVNKVKSAQLIQLTGWLANISHFYCNFGIYFHHTTIHCNLYYNDDDDDYSGLHRWQRYTHIYNTFYSLPADKRLFVANDLVDGILKFNRWFRWDELKSTRY